MKNLEKDTNLFYIPNHIEGNHCFDGVPFTTPEIHDIIGDEGIEEIHNRFETMLSWRKEMLSAKDQKIYGFDWFQAFFDFQSSIRIGVKAIILEEDLQKAVDSSQGKPVIKESKHIDNVIVPKTFKAPEIFNEHLQKDNYVIYKQFSRIKIPNRKTMTPEEWFIKHHTR
jgi:hypothetical protein